MQEENKRLLIWGTGNTAKRLLRKGIKGNLIGFIDTYKPGTFELKPVYTPDAIHTAYDIICVASLYSDDIFEEIEFYHIPKNKVCFINLPLEHPIDPNANRSIAEQILSEEGLNCISYQSWRTVAGYMHYDNQRERDHWVRR